MTEIAKLERKIRNFLSHYPRCYALIVGIGIVLFWRGVWHTADHLHLFYQQTYSSVSLQNSVWWDGPLSFSVGIVILYFTGAFTSSFIGNELILSGLRGEKRLTEKTESEIQGEVRAISDIKDELQTVSQKLELLEHELKHK